MELPIQDLEIINALQIAPRATWRVIGGVLNRNPQTISNRWETLREKGLVWTTAHLTGDPVQSFSAFINVRVEPQHAEETLRQICSIPEVQTVMRANQYAEFRLVSLAPDWETHRNSVLRRLESIPGVSLCSVSLCTHMYTSAERWRLDTLTPAQIRSLESLRDTQTQAPANLSPSFWPMLQVLSRDGRATATSIAATTGQHPTSVGRQLQAAITRGAIVFRCEVAIEATNYPVLVQWFAKVQPNEVDAAATHLSKYRTLRLCASTTGETNFTFAMQIRHAGEIADIEKRLHQAAPTTHIVSSEVSPETYKRMGWMLTSDGRATGQITF